MAFDYAAESAGRPAGAQRVGVGMQSARQRRGDQRHYLVAGVGSAWGPAQVQVPVNQLGKAEVQGQGGGKNQPGIVDQAVVVDRRCGCRRVGCVVASIGCSLFLVGFLAFKTIIPDSEAHPFVSSAGLSHASVRWIGA